MSKLYTIGHSTKSIEDFITTLHCYEIEMLVDVRTIPRSRHNPQYNEEPLKASLENAGIHYAHLPELGGLRRTTKASINLGWRNPSFRGFADYMQTASFWQGIETLEEIANQFKTVITCAEALPWRCHRSLIADVFTIKHWNVWHIMSKTDAHLHKPTPFLQVKKGQFIYPAS